MMPQSKDKIAIIGAGLAGLTVAYRLYQKGYQVDVFEARPRVGGRVHSVLMKNLIGNYSIAELGGQNITDGGQANNICSLAKELGIEIVESNFEFKGDFYDGKNFHERRALFLPLIQDNIFDKIITLSHSCSSMQEILDVLFIDYPIQKRTLTYMLNAYEGLPPQLLSTQSHNLKTLEYMLLGGLSQAHFMTQKDEMMLRASLKDGNATLPLKLFETLNERVHLQKVLKAVTYQKDNEISLKFEDDTVVTCNKLILAIPCTVYDDIVFEHNTISPQRLEQILSLQYGSNGKIILPIGCHDLEKNWIFTDDFGAFRNIDRDLLTLYFLHDDQMSLTEFQYFHEACDIVKNGFKEAFLENSLPQVPDDIQFGEYHSPIIKRWGKDPYSKGSYSTYGTLLQDKIDEKIQYKTIQCKKIFAPIDEKIFFVGEHATILDEIGTMEAAVESGERLAKVF